MHVVDNNNDDDEWTWMIIMKVDKIFENILENILVPVSNHYNKYIYIYKNINTLHIVGKVYIIVMVIKILKAKKDIEEKIRSTR